MSARRVLAIGLSAVILGLAGCSSEGRQEIDGVLWRQTMAHEKLGALLDVSQRETETVLAGLRSATWDRETQAPPDVSGGGMVVYDLDIAEPAAAFSVFLASGPRPDVPRDGGGLYRGPSEVYTCWDVTATFDLTPATTTRELRTECPPTLVEQLLDDAAFVRRDAFDG
ncbi:hypothetical protein [Microbacterium testaceum]|uniref:hypothetical protein n=1 Tax=Microbacterium testaceum TaxID=2033 RepID=UPI0012459194|nr:hypothetical protein [Microbacterium testaceum]